MNETTSQPLANILRLCAAAAPQPWYPSRHARDSGVARDSLDLPLEQLRLGSLIRLTDWEKGLGQGYVLTPEGQKVVQDERLMAGLSEGKSLPKPTATPTPTADPRRRETPFEGGEHVRAFFLDPKPPVVAMTFLWLQILAFLIGFALAQRENVSLQDYLYRGMSPLAVALRVDSLDWLRGEWWRLFTYCLVHGGLLHLFFNSVGLYLDGTAAERMWGHGRFLVLYLLATLGGGCAILLSGPRSAGIGASGAWCGIVAAQLVWIMAHRDALDPRFVAAWKQGFTRVLIMMILISMVPGISAAGHIGGAVVGLVGAVLLHLQWRGKGAARWLALLGLVLLPVVCVATVQHVVATDPRWQELALVVRAQQDGRQANGEGPPAGQPRETAAELEFQQTLLPQVARLENKAVKVVNNAQCMPLLYEPAPRQNKASVETALNALKEAQGMLHQAVNLLRESGPLHDPALELVRQTGVEFLEVRRQMFGVAARCLHEDVALTKADQKELHQLQQKLKELDGRKLAPEK